MAETFPRQYARTQRFTLGEPRDLVVPPDGERVVFLRSTSGTDPVNRLWVRHLHADADRLVADPLALLGLADPGTELPEAERAHRERMREGAGGITAYALDRDGAIAAFALAGRLFVAPLTGGVPRELEVPTPVFDPRPDPTGRRIAYVCDRRLMVVDLDSGAVHELAGEPNESVSWGAADFIAAEEMHRYRGFWWRPDGAAIAACRVDTGPVDLWYIADPAAPDRMPRPIRYPAAGTPNADVSLHIVPLDGSASVEIVWDRAAAPYLADVRWHGDDRLVLTVQSRDQRTLEVLIADAATGACTAAHREHDEAWVELVPGSPTVLDDGRLVIAADRDGRRCVLVDGAPVTPPDVQVRAIAHAGGDITFLGNPLDDATVQHVYRWSDERGVEQLTSAEGVHTVSAGLPAVVRSAVLERPGAVTILHTASRSAGPLIASFAEIPLVAPSVQLLRAGPRRIATAILRPPTDHPCWRDPAGVPVLLDPYGGPHAQRVVRSSNAFTTAQWFADQGFVVVVADGRGTPGRGSAWERAVHRDLATAALDDQVDALHAAAEAEPRMDLGRVAIRGWSFGGYLAALAVLRRPDVFHAAVAGAPVTEWRLYDTHYTERYLGDPGADPAPYDASSLLPLAAGLRRPLLLVHGLADDNVVAAHTLQLSSALLAAGRAHEVLPLVGVSHMTPQEVVAEHLLLHQLDFIRRALTIRS